MNAGKYNHRITLQRRATTENSLGEKTGVWQEAFKVWAKVQPLRGREFFAASQMQVVADTRFVVRCRADITADMRIVWKDEPYEIVGKPIDIDGAGVDLEIMALSGVRDGR